MEIKDDRTTEQKETHTVLIGGTDKCMSGWGKAENGISYAFWSCLPMDTSKVKKWIEERGDIEICERPTATLLGINIAAQHPGNGHCHIYVVNANHPALGGAQ